MKIFALFTFLFVNFQALAQSRELQGVQNDKLNFVGQEIINDLQNDASSLGLDVRNYLKTEIAVNDYVDHVKSIEVSSLDNEEKEQTVHSITAKLALHQNVGNLTEGDKKLIVLKLKELLSSTTL